MAEASATSGPTGTHVGAPPDARTCGAHQETHVRAPSSDAPATPSSEQISATPPRNLGMWEFVCFPRFVMLVSICSSVCITFLCPALPSLQLEMLLELEPTNPRRCLVSPRARWLCPPSGSLVHTVELMQLTGSLGRPFCSLLSLHVCPSLITNVQPCQVCSLRCYWELGPTMLQKVLWRTQGSMALCPSDWLLPTVL